MIVSLPHTPSGSGPGLVKCDRGLAAHLSRKEEICWATPTKPQKLVRRRRLCRMQRVEASNGIPLKQVRSTCKWIKTEVKKLYSNICTLQNYSTYPVVRFLNGWHWYFSWSRPASRNGTNSVTASQFAALSFLYRSVGSFLYKSVTLKCRNTVSALECDLFLFLITNWRLQWRGAMQPPPRPRDQRVTWMVPLPI